MLIEANALPLSQTANQDDLGEMIFLTNHLAGTSKTKYNYNQMTMQTHKQ